MYKKRVSCELCQWFGVDLSVSRFLSLRLVRQKGKFRESRLATTSRTKPFRDLSQLLRTNNDELHCVRFAITSSPSQILSTLHNGRWRQSTVSVIFIDASVSMGRALTQRRGLVTPSTSGRRPVVGTHNPPTGRPTRPSWVSSSSASQRLHSLIAQGTSSERNSLSKAASTQADGIASMISTRLQSTYAVLRWSKQIKEHEARER